MSRSPALSEVLEGVRAASSADVRVACIARVVRWDSATPREVDVQPVHLRAYTDEEGARATDKQPVIPSVPLVYPGGGGFVVTWPMTVGDEVLLVFSDDSLDKYLQVGGQSDIDPADDRRHSLTDAVAFAGIRSLGTATSVATGAVQIGTNGGAFQGVALGADIKTYLDGHTHAVACPPGGGNVLSSAPSASVTGLPLDPSPAASATVKVTS